MSQILRPGQRIQRVVLHKVSALVDYDLASAVCDLFQIAADLDVQSDVPPGAEFCSLARDTPSNRHSFLLICPRHDRRFRSSPCHHNVRYDGTTLLVSRL